MTQSFPPVLEARPDHEKPSADFHADTSFEINRNHPEITVTALLLMS